MERYQHDDNSDIREGIIWAVNNIEDPRAAEPLILALQNEDSVIREEAADILLYIRDDIRAVEPLTALLKKEQNAMVYRAIIYALKEIKSRN